MKNFLWTFVVVGLACSSVALEINYGIYQDLRISVSDNVPRQKCQRALDNLEALITSVSSQLYDATGGRGRFGSIEVTVPSGWNKEDCLRSRQLKPQSISEKAQIQVESPHPIFGSQPHAEQYGQCGVAGEQLTLPYTLLTDNVRVTQQNRVRTFQEWSRYRYGIFPERGFKNDPIYPYFWQVGPQKLPNEGCNTTFSYGDFNATENVRLMALCTNEADYNPYTPTKQNILCSGKSALKTILSHPDFISSVSGNKSETLGIQVPPPKFSYSLKKKTLSIILVLDISSKMASKWSRTRDALFRLVSHMPSGSELGIISAKSKEAVVNVEPTVVLGSNREGLHGRIPYRLLNEHDACIQCGIEKATAMFNPDHIGSIIVVSNSYLDLWKPSESTIPIHQVFFEDTWDNSTSRTKNVEENGVNFKVPPRKILQNLSAIFLQLLKLSNGPRIECTHQRFYHFEQNHIGLAYEDEYHLVSGNKISGTFSVEKELSTDLWVILTPEPAGFEEDVQVFKITSPSGRKWAFPKYAHGIVYFHFEAQNNEAGIWTFEAELHPIVAKTRGSRVSLEVFGQQSNAGNAVTLDFWTFSNPTSTILYAKVTQDRLPIQDAHVEALVYPPDSKEPTRLILADKGSGYPDITHGDGIYSAYLTNQPKSAGFFSVIISADYNSGQANLPKFYGHADSECCGSSLPDFYAIPTSPFSRVLPGKSFSVEVDQKALNKDIFPPNRITDLRLKSYPHNSSLYATLEWTAPGDDFDKGQAFRYEMRCYTHPGSLVNLEDFLNKAIAVHETLLPTPQVAGSVQSITVALPWPNEVFYYAMTTLDESNNRADISNLLPVYVEEIKTTTQLDLTFRVVNTTELMTSKFEAALDNDTMIYIISGGITAFLLILIVLFTVALCRAKRKRAGVKERPKPLVQNSEHQNAEANIYVVNSNAEQPLSSVTTTTSVLPDVTANNESKNYVDFWKMDSLIDSGYINTYFRGSSSSQVAGMNSGGNGNYPSLQAFPLTSQQTQPPMSLLSLNISHNPKPHQLMTNSHSQTNLSNLAASHLPLQVFRNGSGSSAGTSNSRDASPTYQNWSQNNNIISSKDESKKTGGSSDCTSSTECSEDSDRNSDNSGGHTNPEKKPTPAPRTTLDNSSVSSKNIVSLVKQVRHESLV